MKAFLQHDEALLVVNEINTIFNDLVRRLESL
jgi:hypothetical protein